MADAPSGGSGWGPFEIFLIAVLAIGLLSSITNKGKITPVFQTDTAKESVSDTSANKCGLSITAPLSLENVSGGVHLAGSVHDCNWKPSGTTALFAQVVNGAGVPVSDFVPVQQVGESVFDTPFDTTITINGNPSGTGYLILIPATQTEKPITVRIPLHFVRK